ncbi:MAG: hypothetical protein NVS3B16_27300 [Vulcanimicrobiaceae bacterium]
MHVRYTIRCRPQKLKLLIILRDKTIAGRLTIETGFPGYRTFDVYHSRRTPFVSRPMIDGEITIDSEGGPAYTGRVCVGIMDEDRLK